MGLEATCEVRVAINQSTSASAVRKFKAKVELDGEQIIVRGPEGFRLKFRELASIEAHHGVLSLADGKRRVELVLGRTADRWAEKAKSPPGRLEKLGIKTRTRVALIGRVPGELREEIVDGGAVVVRGGTVELVLLAAREPRDLDQLSTLKEWIAPDGAIWIIRERGADDVTEREMRDAGSKAGLVAIKVARISDKYTSDKFVIPRRDR